MNTFFDAPRPASQAKARIIARFFGAWASIIGNATRRLNPLPILHFRDFFAGPGTYKDGTKSTPALVLDIAADNELIRERVQLHFNDIEPSFTESLRELIKLHSKVDKLRLQPEVTCGDAEELIQQIKADPANRAPTLSFLDPFGYTGFSLESLKYLLSNWGNDCVFYFDADAIIRALSNPLEPIRAHLETLLGKEGVAIIKMAVEDKAGAQEKEACLITELTGVLNGIGAAYVLPFRLTKDNSEATSYYLMFITKDFKGYDEMKESMQKESTSVNLVLEVQQFSDKETVQSSLFGEDIYITMARKRLLDPTPSLGAPVEFESLYRALSTGTPLVRRHFKAALLDLEEQGLVLIEPSPGKRRRKGFVGDTNRITFKRNHEHG